eukprot:gnl/Spiro4/24058_TR11924_c0_g1_i1.p1 gnl/Spiro4/24058_TR11924_c0_g1~~gnl/Spiro4/24058_TR11924_c0_g1_i1.p1  ORF type:complete len:429 (+),score=91.58 gnl/Spiro4/24058_TR11924_c0_g1_i1:74-1360(+)
MSTEKPLVETKSDPEAGPSSGGDEAAPGAFDNDESADLTTRDSVRVRIYYAGLFFLIIFFCLFINAFNLDSWLKHIKGFDGCSASDTTDDQQMRCRQFSLAFRGSLALCLFFSFIGFLLCASKLFASYRAFDAVVHAEFFWFKSILLVGVFIGTLWIPQESIESYGHAAMWFSFLFIIVQTLMLIEFSYAWHDLWKLRAWFCGYLTATATMYALSITLVVLMFHWFTDGVACGENKFFIIFTIVCFSLFSIMSVASDSIVSTLCCVEGTDPSKVRGILPASVVTLYTTYMCFSALFSQPNADDQSCNHIFGSNSQNGWMLLLSIIICGVSVAYSAVSAGGTQQSLRFSSVEEDETAKALNVAYFHVVMALASLYSAMMMTGWQVDGLHGDSVSTGRRTMWIKIISEWFTILVYSWTTVAPQILSDRTF